MHDSTGPKGPPPALVAALSLIAVCAFFPGAVIWIVASYWPIHDPQVAADRLRGAAFWVTVGLLSAEYVVLRARARVGR